MVTRYFDKYVSQVILHDSHRADHSIEIGQRFTHAHQHHIRDRFLHAPGGKSNLTDYLGHAQVAVEALLRGWNRSCS